MLHIETMLVDVWSKEFVMDASSKDGDEALFGHSRFDTAAYGI